MNEALYKSETWLIENYWHKKMSLRQMAEKYGYSRNSLREYLDKFRIPRRSLSEARLLNFPDKPYRNKKILYKSYWREGNSLDGLSKLWNCDRQTVKFWLKRYGIPRRNTAERYKLRKKTNKERFYGSTWNRLILIARDFIGSLKKYF